MNVLMIGGTSQDAFFLMHEHLDKGDRVFATFRTSKSVDWRRQQLLSAPSRIENFHPVIFDYLDHAPLVKLIDEKEVDIVYYLASINLPSRVSIDSEAKREMRRIHVEFPVRLLHTLIGMPDVRGVFPLSSKMFSLKGDTDLVVSVNESPNPQNYYGETRSEFWKQLKIIRNSHPVKVLSPILFNHESIYRFSRPHKEQFVIQRLRDLLLSGMSINKVLESGIDFAAREDWLNASDVSAAIYRLIQAEYFGDIVIASGRGSSIFDLLYDFLEERLEHEASRKVKQEMIKFKDKRPCLIGDVRDLHQIIGKVESKIVLA